MLAAGHAASHVRKVHAILSSAYEDEVKRGNVARNPCRLVEAPALGQREMPVLTQAQARAILSAAAERRNAARWSVGLACGLRQGEALGLRWQYADLDRGELRVGTSCSASPGGTAAPSRAAGRPGRARGRH